MENALELRGVTKRYKAFELSDVSLTLPMGCIMGFIGENGAGKSTTIKLILDMVRRDGGEITVLGADNRSRAFCQTKEHLGVVMDESCLHDTLTPGQVDRVMSGIYKTWSGEEYNRLLERFSLPRGKLLKEFSRGMKMKVSLAVAMAHDARLLLLDEATSGLDPLVRDELFDSFFEFISTGERAILLSSHIISDVEKVCDYVALLHKGSLLLSDEKDRLLERYAVLKCGEEEFAAVNPAAVRGVRRHRFGVEALVEREQVDSRLTLDRATLEDIMLYHVKGDAK